MFSYITSTPERAAHTGLSSLTGNLQENYPSEHLPGAPPKISFRESKTPMQLGALCLDCDSGSNGSDHTLKKLKVYVVKHQAEETVQRRAASVCLEEFRAAGETLSTSNQSKHSLAERTCETGSG